MPSIAFPPSLASDRAFDLIGLGANAADHLVVVPHHPAPGEKVRFTRYLRQGGGQAATALVVAARLGYRTRYLGGVGEDAEGERNLEELAREGVEVARVRRRADAMTQRAFIFIDERTGERTILWGRDPGVMLQPEELTAEEIACGRMLHVDGQNPCASACAARHARAAGMPVLADLETIRPGTDELLPLVDFLIAAEEFPRAVTGSADPHEALRILEERCGGGLVIVTLGARGALARIEGRLRHVPAFAIEARDTTGAGDVFHGAFAVAGCLGLTLVDAIDFSHAVAAMKCLGLGGRTAIPRDLAEIERFRRTTPRHETTIGCGGFA
jgi:sugar/nucleoside kinase (ribokinase family)